MLNSQLQKMLASVQKNKAALEQKIKTIQETEFKSVVGNGLIEVVMNGKYEIVKCDIDQKALSDKDTVEDLVISAVNDVLSQISSELERAQKELIPRGLF